MAKREAEALEQSGALKDRERPQHADDTSEDSSEAGEFEDEYGDDIESEDEIFEAGIDGRPDDEREAEEKLSR